MWSPLQEKTAEAIISRSVILMSGCRNKLVNEEDIPSFDVAVFEGGGLVSSGAVCGVGAGEGTA